MVGPSNSQTRALSNRGDVVFITYGAEQHAYSWRAGVRHDLCVSLGAPSAANDARYLAGESTFNGAGAHAFVWRDGRVADLGTLPGDTVSTAWAINNANELAGSSGQRSGVARDTVAPAPWDTSNRLLEPMKRPRRRAATNQEDAGRTVGAVTHRRPRPGFGAGVNLNVRSS
jgi:probable HAF family extracellular repeat protein